MNVNRRESKRLNNLIEKHIYLIDLLVKCGGSLYFKDLYELLEMPRTTVRHQLKILEKDKLIKINEVLLHGKKHLTVRITTKCYKRLQIDDSISSVAHKTLCKNLDRAIILKYLKNENIKDEKENLLLTINQMKIIKSPKNLQGLISQLTSFTDFNDKLKELGNNQKFIISNLKEDEIYHPEDDNITLDIELEVIYISRNIFKNELFNNIDLIVAILEFYAKAKSRFITSDFKSKIKLKLTIITSNKVNKVNLKNKLINHRRKYDSLSYEITKNAKLYNTYRFAMNKDISYMYIDNIKKGLVKY